MKSKLKTLSCVLAVVLCLAAFSVTAFAADGGYYASNENAAETPPDSIDSIVVGTENVQLPEGGGGGSGEALTPDGNLTLIDDILEAEAFVSDENERAEKQFITVQSKNGNYFYLVIDRAGDTENVYFLNLVDEADVDEAHAFQDLFLYTKMRNVAGLSTSDAQKSSDMLLKCRYIDEVTDSKGVVFATGTPVSNSMTELYTMMRYLQHDTIRDKGLAHFDCWASTFGETTTAIELAPEGYTLVGR